ncbi:glutathione-specific gamma-glutamylcyclotransferase 1 [Diachasma alloeum]|uniref:glutathione-specific gamma-glutamylcyclotransferase 1 n=1 Tax=Diachasma alloeum TaxID=454923 RepID=UPI00073815C2|nr:glutathione-specific gamma-glutamylcyclotransferase 1 [Diachasma alloeum]
MAAATGLWVFGYGSLCWNPGFEFKRSMTGHVKGFGRRFWQGNDSHRGTSAKPGRVATLIDDKKEITYGRAFEVTGSAALPYLEKRECTLGGYLTTISTFHSRDGSHSFPVVIYIATNKNKHWLGDAPIHAIAQQILESEGPSGHNVEYLLRLADFIHQFIPEAHDEHLFTLELIVRAKVKELNLCLKTLMGNREFHIQIEIDRDSDSSDNDVQDLQDDVPRRHSYHYTSRIAGKTLRCVKP